MYDAAAAGAAKHIERLLRDCKRQVDDVLDGKNAATPLFAAAARGHLRAVEALLAVRRSRRRSRHCRRVRPPP